MKSVEELKAIATQQEAERIARVKRNIIKYNLTAERVDQVVQEAAMERKEVAEKEEMQKKILLLEQQLAERDRELTELKEKLATIRKVAA